MSDRERQAPYEVTYNTWNLKSNTNEFTSEMKQTHRFRKQTQGQQRGEEGKEGLIWGMGLIDTNQVLSVKQISSKGFTV